MNKLFGVNPSSFIILHMYDPNPKLAVGSTIYWDKKSNYDRIPRDRFERQIAKYYLTTLDNSGPHPLWTVTGYVDAAKESKQKPGWLSRLMNL